MKMLTILKFKALFVIMCIVTCFQYVSAEVISTTFYHNDVIGSPIAATDEGGNEKWRESYRPFGSKRFDEVEAADNSRWYTGHPHDEEFGLTYAGARYYDPVIGRFYSRDPVDYTVVNPIMSFNKYLYANNNPYTYNDPDGEFLNFAIKFALDVGLNVALQAASGQQIDVGAAVLDSALGVFNPAKTVAKAAKLAKILRKSPCGCFVAGTDILTKEGLKDIESLKVGDVVWAKNTDTGEQAWKPITDYFLIPGRDIYELSLIDADGDVQKIEVSDDHPFFVVGEGWRETLELKVGDYIETDGGEAVMLTSIVDMQRQDLTYNFTVADFHTYYVTERKVLVHNCGGVTKSVGPKVGSAGGDGAKKAFSTKVKDQARKESNDTCVFCKTKTTREPGPTRSEIDHSIPKSRGGNNTLENAQNTCRTCNRQKGAKTSDEFLNR